VSQLAIVENVRRALQGEPLAAPADALSVAVVKLREHAEELEKQNEHLEDQNAQLRLEPNAEVERLRARLAELEGDAGEPEVLPCTIYPDEAMTACPQALRGGGAPGESDVCAEAGACHAILEEKVPGLVRLHEHAHRVGAPS
jgi:hypothetical protein